jgi:hypothetical protein
MMTNKTTAGAEAGFDLDKLKPIIDEIKAAIDEVCRGADVFMASMLAAQKIDVLARRAAPATADKPVQAGEAVDNLTPQSLDLLRKGLRDWETPENRYAAQRVLDAIEARASLAPVSAQQGAADPECDSEHAEKGFPCICAAKAPAAQADARDVLAAKVLSKLDEYRMAITNGDDDWAIRARGEISDALYSIASPASTPEAAPGEPLGYISVDAHGMLKAGRCVSIAVTTSPDHRRVAIYAAPTAGAATTSEDARDAARLDLLLDISGFHFEIIDQKQHLLDARGRIAGIGATKREAIDAALRATQQEGE